MRSECARKQERAVNIESANKKRAKKRRTIMRRAERKTKIRRLVEKETITVSLTSHEQYILFILLEKDIKRGGTDWARTAPFWIWIGLVFRRKKTAFVASRVACLPRRCWRNSSVLSERCWPRQRRSLIRRQRLGRRPATTT